MILESYAATGVEWFSKFWLVLQLLEWSSNGTQVQEWFCFWNGTGTQGTGMVLEWSCFQMEWNSRNRNGPEYGSPGSRDGTPMMLMMMLLMKKVFR